MTFPTGAIATIDWDKGHTAGSTSGQIVDFSGQAYIRLDVVSGVT